MGTPATTTAITIDGNTFFWLYNPGKREIYLNNQHGQTISVIYIDPSYDRSDGYYFTAYGDTKGLYRLGKFYLVQDAMKSVEETWIRRMKFEKENRHFEDVIEPMILDAFAERVLGPFEDPVPL